MTFRIENRKSGRIFDADPAVPVLEAAQAAGITFAYGCRNGACGACKGKVLDGRVDHGPHQPYTLTDTEKQQGFALFCCARPLTDLVIEARELAGVGDIPVKKLPCRVLSLAKPAPDVAILELKLPANERFQFRAGQYVEMLLRDGRRRAYSMANPPSIDDRIELHVRHLPGGAFTEPVFTTMKEKDILRFEGPMGTFFLREDSDKPMVFVASGTGFAPIQAMLEHAFASGSMRPMVLYWGGRRPRDLYRAERCLAWEAAHPHFTFIP
ncbi:MAG: CDP-6-deoxy-delta-3,4-glucoseen reductase, partial [Burkholderiales bacterium]|nr:CDP-6-deoxy-delta-3,4-glucoseen reductase [Burkholderiales bacterium]